MKETKAKKKNQIKFHGEGTNDDDDDIETTRKLDWAKVYIRIALTAADENKQKHKKNYSSKNNNRNV